MWTVAELLLAFVVLYPLCTAAMWIAGGLLFRVLDEPDAAVEPEGGWPGVVGALYPVAFWLVSATAALHSEGVALVRGPSGSRVVWNIPREHLDREQPTAKTDQHKP